MKKLIFIVSVLLIATVGFAGGIRILTGSRMGVGGSGIHAYKSDSETTFHDIVNTAAVDVKNSTGGQVYARD